MMSNSPHFGIISSLQNMNQNMELSLDCLSLHAKIHRLQIQLQSLNGSL